MLMCTYGAKFLGQDHGRAMHSLPATVVSFNCKQSEDTSISKEGQLGQLLVLAGGSAAILWSC
jgi:hypothetical protein